MYLVIIRLLYSLCCIVIADRRGAQRQGEQGEQNIYTMRRGCARGGPQGVKGPKDSYWLFIFFWYIISRRKSKVVIYATVLTITSDNNYYAKLILDIAQENDYTYTQNMYDIIQMFVTCTLSGAIMRRLAGRGQQSPGARGACACGGEACRVPGFFPDPPGKTGERLIIYIIYISHAFKTLSGKQEAIS